MTRYVVRRLLIAVPVFLGITVLAFVLVRQAPGDPIAMMINPEMMAGGGDAYVAQRRAELRLDDPLPVQYVAWLGEVVRGDLGFSYTTRRPVTELIAGRIGPTVRLMGTALIIALAVGIPVGVMAALKRNTWVDYLSGVLSMATISTPSFFLGLVAIYVFSLRLGILPTSGMLPTGGNPTYWDGLRHLVMPASVLGLALACPVVRYTRTGLLDVLGQDYLTTARSKGVAPLRIIRKHALRNALIPLITVIAVQIPVMIGGAVVIEQIFNWPGMGQLALSAIEARDYPVLMGFMMVVAFAVLVCNVVADLAYALIDPRIRVG